MNNKEILENKKILDQIKKLDKILNNAIKICLDIDNISILKNYIQTIKENQYLDNNKYKNMIIEQIFNKVNHNQIASYINKIEKMFK